MSVDIIALLAAFLRPQTFIDNKKIPLNVLKSY
jgi:hypothetical protein